MTPFMRRMLLGVALVGTAVAAIESEKLDKGAPATAAAVAAPARSDRGAAERPGAAPAALPATPARAVVDLTALERRLSGGTPAAEAPPDVFPAKSWVPPPPPVAPRPVRVEPPKPVAPPLRFKYLGQMEEAGQKVVFLELGDRSHAVRKGESVEGGYRVEDITAAAIVFTYTPLGERQTLPIDPAGARSP
jgi:hypothetical protein